jgi:cell division transport system permease protein
VAKNLYYCAQTYRMSENMGQKAAKKRRPSFVYAILSITMVLMMTGILAILVFYTQKAITKVRESIELEVILNTDSKDLQVVELRNFLSGQPYIKSQEFITKEEAAKNYAKEIGQDFVDALGFNPLYDAFILRLNADYSNMDSISVIQAELLKHAVVQEVSYSRAVVELVSARMKNVSLVVMGVAGALLILAFSLIDSTIRLLMFSQRFIIRSMQLIGATRWFIIKPFMLRGVFTGAVSGFITIITIGLLLLYIENRFHIGFEQKDGLILAGIAIGIMGAGIIISTISTYFAVRKYLRIKLDDLY